MLTIADRVASYAASDEGQRFPDSVPVLSSAGGFMHGHWIMGRDYRSRSRLYGAYPPRYVPRVWSLFPEVQGREIAHVFSGSVEDGEWMRIDRSLARTPSPRIYADAQALPFLPGRAPWLLWMGDPPYTKPDAKRYGTKMVNRQATLLEIARVVPAGTNLVWLDTTFPMFAKREWRWWGAISILRSTNHRVREAFFFERVRRADAGDGNDGQGGADLRVRHPLFSRLDDVDAA